MQNMNAAWAKAEEDLERLALKLHLHLEQLEPSHADHENVRQALGLLTSEVAAAVGALGNAVADGAVREDARAAAVAVADAVAATFTQAGHDLVATIRRSAKR